MRRADGVVARPAWLAARAGRWCLAASAAFALTLPAPSLAADDSAGFRFSAPIAVIAPATFVELALPPAAYAHSRQRDLRDLRIVDTRGERVPFAQLPAGSARHAEQRRPAALYPLPARRSSAGTWDAPIDVVVDGDRVHVTRHNTADGGSAAPAGGVPGGWLFDLGDPAERGEGAAEPPAHALRVAWTGPDEFAAPYSLETSGDLRTWRPAGGGQLMALASRGGALTQPLVELPGDGARFVRLVWFDPAAAPRLSGADALRRAPADRAGSDATELVFEPVPAPSGARDPAAPRALYFDLGAVLPLVDVNLRFGDGTRVAPVRVQGRGRADAPWRDLAQGVFYQLDRNGMASVAPALPVGAEVRFLRIVPDERAAALDPVATRLVARARLAHLVFVAQGAAPYRLLAGSADAAAGALPLSALVPNVADERARFGRARVGPWSEVASEARAAEAAAQRARWRPWLLWGVLVIGVVALAVMVLRLARSEPGAGR